MENYTSYIEKLRSSGLRATKQRLKICKVLFNTSKTFHFTVENLKKLIEDKFNEKMSLATIYNTVNAFRKKGYLQQLNISSNKTYYDTNTSQHHHFFDEKEERLIDIEPKDILLGKLPNIPNNKTLKSVEIVVKVANNSQNQK